MLGLTAEFGMGSGRTTALWPPKSSQTVTTTFGGVLQRFCAARHDFKSFKEHGVFPENYTQRYQSIFQFIELKIAFLRNKEKAIKPHDRLVSVR